MNTNNQLAVVTGASSGIGERFASLLARKGYNLIITARRVKRLEEIAQRLVKENKVKVFCVASDLLVDGGARKLYQQCRDLALKENLKITILINNAGMGQWKAFNDTPIQRHLNGIQLNITALTELSFYFISEMKNHGKESYIMNVASLAAFLPGLNYAVYAAGKRYVYNFSNALFYELEKSNIHVHCFCPGGTESEFMEAAGQVVTSFARKKLMSAQRVAEIGLKNMFLKKKMSIPGLGNKISFIISRILPERMNKYLLEKIMSKSIK